MLSIKNLHARIGDTPILKGLNLEIGAGEVHAIMGPNGSGKSTLANVLAGREDYEVTDGTVVYCGKNLLEMSIEQRAREGLFLAFQYPVELPGVNNNYFLRTAVNAVRKHRGQPKLSAKEFLKEIERLTDLVKICPAMLSRAVNEGFSGGEKKRNEVLQMALLEPRFAVLDETDSGLDIDALQIVSEGVNALRAENRSFLVITHYQRLLNYIVPDRVHVLAHGQIVESGPRELALQLEEEGYRHVVGNPTASTPPPDATQANTVQGAG